jgi:hypothetical protein
MRRHASRVLLLLCVAGVCFLSGCGTAVGGSAVRGSTVNTPGRLYVVGIEARPVSTPGTLPPPSGP